MDITKLEIILLQSQRKHTTGTYFHWQQGVIYMLLLTDRTTHITAFGIPVIGHWLIFFIPFALSSQVSVGLICLVLKLKR